MPPLTLRKSTSLPPQTSGSPDVLCLAAVLLQPLPPSSRGHLPSMPVCPSLCMKFSSPFLFSLSGTSVRLGHSLTVCDPHLNLITSAKTSFLNKGSRPQGLARQHISLRDTKRKYADLDHPGILLNRKAMTSFESEEVDASARRQHQGSRVQNHW